MAYGACADPQAGHAKRISVLVDEDGNVEKLYSSVKPAEHPDEVLRDLG